MKRLLLILFAVNAQAMDTQYNLYPNNSYQQYYLHENSLIEAIQKHNNDLIDYLLKNNLVNINYRNHLDQTALIVAIQKNDLELVKLLITYRAYVNTQHNGGTTPLMTAYVLNRNEISDILRNSGAVALLKDDTGQLETASKVGYFYEATQLLADGLKITPAMKINCDDCLLSREKMKQLFKDYAGHLYK